MKNIAEKIKQGLSTLLSQYNSANLREKGILWSSGLITLTLAVFLMILGIYWSQEPEPLQPHQLAQDMAGESGGNIVPGYTTTATLIKTAEYLLDKPGGYLSNDVLPPASLFGMVHLLDNIPNREFGTLIMVRDTARILRNDFSRSQSQSLENKHLAEAEPRFNFANNSWLFPPTENQYRFGIEELTLYLGNLAAQSDPNTQFYTRADNLNELLGVVEKRLGDYSRRLNASVQELRTNTDLAGDPDAEQATRSPALVIAETPWMEIDDVFYEARGYTWALLGILRAIEIDFNGVLKKKNAIASLQQVIRLLEQTQTSPSSPMVLNGDPMGWIANYSKTLVSYISPANAAIIDLRNLLNRG